MTEQGWRAACSDCPARQEFAPNIKVDADLWAFLHRDQNQSHRAEVTWFKRVTELSGGVA